MELASTVNLQHGVMMDYGAGAQKTGQPTAAPPEARLIGVSETAENFLFDPGVARPKVGVLAIKLDQWTVIG